MLALTLFSQYSLQQPLRALLAPRVSSAARVTRRVEQVGPRPVSLWVLDLIIVQRVATELRVDRHVFLHLRAAPLPPASSARDQLAPPQLRVRQPPLLEGRVLLEEVKDFIRVRVLQVAQHLVLLAV